MLKLALLQVWRGRSAEGGRKEVTMGEELDDSGGMVVDVERQGGAIRREDLSKLGGAR